MNRANASVAVVYTYTSATAAVATVSAAGMVTAVAPGTTTITVTAAGTGTGFAAASLTSAATITVSDRAPGLTSLQVSPATAALTVGGTQSVTASAQGPRAAAATITYGTSAPAIATVSATGVITAVAAGTATITVTAQSTQDGAFAASSLTGLVTVTVSNPAVVSINISALTQGPTTTSYVVGTTGATGIVSAANGQVGQAIDINNTRDQIQMTATLATNGARVDSVVAYVANADGTSRTSVGSQSYPSAAASGPVSLYINTADFTADFTAGTAAVKFANGQKRISVSAFSGATELQSTNSQTVNFNNVDGYASQLAAPARSITTAAGVIWHGGGDSTTANMGRAVIVPVFYTPSRVPASITLDMRQTSATATIAACGSSARNNLLSAPFAARFGGTRAATQASATATAAIGDSTVLNCGTLESAADHVIGVTGGTDNSGTALPLVTYAGGFRTSSTVTAPTALKLDYVAPTATAINITRAAPAVTGWVNAAYNFTTETAATTDAGVGIADLGTVVGKGGRTWSYYGCTTILSTAPTSFTGLAGEIPDCATNLTATAYTVQYSQEDRLVNRSALVTASVGVDAINPVGRWSSTSTAADSIGSGVTIALTPEFSDARSGFIDDVTAATPTVVTERAVRAFIVRANQVSYAATAETASPYKNSTGAVCYNLAGTAISVATSSFTATSACTVSATGNALLGTINGEGYRAGSAYSSTVDGIHSYVVRATDKAGNSVTISRKAMDDAAGPTAVLAGTPASISTSSNPTLSVSYEDNVKVLGGALHIGYGNVDGTSGNDVFVGPYQSLSTAFGTPLNATNLSSFTMTGYTPVPMVSQTRIQAAAVAVAYAKIATFNAEVIDAINSATVGSASAMAAANITTVTATLAEGSVAVSTSLTGGLTAIHTTSASGTQVYDRVDFYRQVTANDGNGADSRYEYLGSGTTAVAGLSSSNLITYSYTIGSYANKPTAAVVQPSAASGQTIIAMAVRSTGAAAVTTTQVLGGAAVQYTIAGLPAGATAPVTITGGTFTLTQSSPNGTHIVGVPASGLYTVTTSSVGVGSATYSAGASPSLSANVTGTAAVTAGTFTFASQILAVAATVTGVPTGGSINLVLTQAGQTTITVATGTVTGLVIPVTSVGAWVITPQASKVIYGQTFTPGAATTSATAAVGSSAVAAAATVAYGTVTPMTVITNTFETVLGTLVANAAVPVITAYKTGGTTLLAGVNGFFVGPTTNVYHWIEGTVLCSVTTSCFLTHDSLSVGGTIMYAANSTGVIPLANGTSTAAVPYYQAKAAAVFAGSTAELIAAAQSVNVTYTGPTGVATVRPLTVSTTNSNAFALPIRGTYTATIPSITLGDALYSFSVPSLSVTAVASASAVLNTISVVKTQAMGDPILSSAADWTNSLASSAPTRTVSPDPLLGTTPTYSGVTCTVTGSAALITVSSVNASTGVCTIGASGTATGTVTYTITWQGTATLAGHPNRTVTKTFTIDRTVP